MTAIRFEHVDVIFGKQNKRALELLDQGKGRSEILQETGQVLGVEDACLEVQKGEICVLMGLSGSGKSSLLRCINGLNTVSRGKLLIEHKGSEVDIANCSPAVLKDMRTTRIAMVFQKFALMPWLTVAENVGFGLEMQGRSAAERKKLVEEKLELVGLTQWRNKKPDSLSGGMQQRVGLARALAMDADILLMDEPFSALDPLIRQQLHLDVAGALETALQVHAGIAEGTRRLGARASHSVEKTGGVAHYAHSLATAAGNGLDHQRVADRRGNLQEPGVTDVSWQRTVCAWHNGNTGTCRQALGFGLAPHQRDRLRRRADEDE